MAGDGGARGCSSLDLMDSPLVGAVGDGQVLGVEKLGQVDVAGDAGFPQSLVVFQSVHGHCGAVRWSGLEKADRSADGGCIEQAWDSDMMRGVDGAAD